MQPPRTVVSSTTCSLPLALLTGQLRRLTAIHPEPAAMECGTSRFSLHEMVNVHNLHLQIHRHTQRLLSSCRTLPSSTPRYINGRDEEKPLRPLPCTIS